MSRVTKQAVSSEFRPVTFGVVTMMLREPTPEEIKQHARESQRVAKALPKALTIKPRNPKVSPDIPLYSVDPKNPELVMQQLNGKKKRGYFNNGKFVEV